jgi:hypothetical protein
VELVATFIEKLLLVLEPVKRESTEADGLPLLLVYMRSFKAWFGAQCLFCHLKIAFK